MCIDMTKGDGMMKGAAAGFIASIWIAAAAAVVVTTAS